MIHIFFSLFKIFLCILSGRKIISSRCACLGLESLNGYTIINRQKYRIDLPWNRSIREALFSIPKIKAIIRYPIRNLVFQQIFNLWKISIKNSDFFIMDTYSELTDRKYCIDGLIFCCHKSDLNKNLLCNLEGSALIDPESLGEYYRNFFKTIKRINTKIKIIVILFPVKFEEREVFKTQYLHIKKSLKSCLDLEINLIELSSADIYKHPDDVYPYHFDGRTIDSLRHEIDNLVSAK